MPPAIAVEIGRPFCGRCATMPLVSTTEPPSRICFDPCLTARSAPQWRTA